MAAGSGLPAVLVADLPAEQDPVRQLLTRWVPWVTHGDVFSSQSFGAGPWPAQGWKLHVAATPLSAASVLDRTLPVLLAEGVRFKVVSTRTRLLALNAGQFGASQVGKFLTIYPSDDAQAIRLAVALDEGTRGLAGPRVPTDRPLRPGSLVHYRYGAFRGGAAPAGDDEPALPVYDLLDPAGRLTYDPRPPFYLPPPGRVDPFTTAGVTVSPPASSGPFAGRYLIVGLLGRTWRGGVFRAIDLAARPARVCLLKEVWHDVGTDRYGHDARRWVENEARLLGRHDGDPLLPRCYDRFEHEGNAYISLEYVDGVPLDRELADDPALLTGIPADDLIAIGRGTAAALAHLHAIGIVFRDFKPANVIRAPAGGYRLIDFGIAYDRVADDGAPPLGLGTPPYYSPEQYADAPPAPADDVFAWGAVMHELACGLDSLQQPGADGESLRPAPRRPVGTIRPAFPAALAAVIDRAVAWERADRYPTMQEALAALETAAAEVEPIVPHGQRTTALHAGASGPAAAPAHEDPLVAARAVGDALCAAAMERDGGLCWAARDPVDGRAHLAPDLYSGAAGVGLFLAELARATGEERYAASARGAARWLAGPTWGAGRALPGLHAGEGGVGAFFLRLAELLDEPGYVAAAELRARRLVGIPFHAPDLLAGEAGTVLFLVRLATATGDGAYLCQARAAGDVLLRTARPGPGGVGCFWDVAPLDPSEAACPYLGMAHGVAGIALALDALGAATGDEAYLACARQGAELLLAQSRSQGGGSAWPPRVGDTRPGLQAWCHGAGGIGLFFLRLSRRDPDPRYAEAARQAARTIAEEIEGREHSGLCHGLAGDGCLFLEYERTLGDARYLELAQRCFQRLATFRAPERGMYRMSHADVVSPDLLLGYAGVGAFFLRLARPEPVPRGYAAASLLGALPTSRRIPG